LASKNSQSDQKLSKDGERIKQKICSNSRLRAIKKIEEFGSGGLKTPTKRMSRVSRGMSKTPREACSETISIRPIGASSADGTRSSVSRQQSRNVTEQTVERLESRSDTIPRGDSIGQLPGTASQSKDCPNILRGTLEGAEISRHPQRVFVISNKGEPLAPCSPAKARKLLKSGEAVVASRDNIIFTIRLKRTTSCHTQPMDLKLDPGSKYTGLALVSNGAPLLKAEIQHRGDLIHKNIESRSACRGRRRNANLRYREARFDNRKKPDGWLPPSLRHRIENILSWIYKFRKIAPITGFVQELVRFDLQKIDNPEISGIEYQQGTLAGYEVREYLLEKWNRKCVYCGDENIPLEIEHVVSRAGGGTNRISNLTLSCHRCNQSKGKLPIELFLKNKPDLLKKITSQLKKPLKDAAAVNSTRWTLFNKLKETGLTVNVSSGGRTKFNRCKLKIPKTHANDAICVGTVENIRYWNIPTIIIKSIGRGSHQVVMSDSFGFPRSKTVATHTRIRHLTNKKGECRDKIVKTKGDLMKVKGLCGKRPFGFATGDTIKIWDGRIGRITAARSDGRITVRIYSEIKDLEISKGKIRLCKILERSNGYSVDSVWQS